MPSPRALSSCGRLTGDNDTGEINSEFRSRFALGDDLLASHIQSFGRQSDNNHQIATISPIRSAMPRRHEKNVCTRDNTGDQSDNALVDFLPPTSRLPERTIAAEEARHQLQNNQ